MIGIATEKWDVDRYEKVVKWLKLRFGSQSIETWYIDVQYGGIFDLVMSDEIHFWYKTAFND